MKESLLAILAILLLTSSCSSFNNEEVTEEFPTYGNWCGPIYPASGTNPDPIDQTDAICEAHDLCYEQKGYFNAACDAALISQLKEADISKMSSEEKYARKAILAYFSHISDI